VAIHRNTGAPFRRKDGTKWERGQDAEPTQDELRLRRYKLKPVVAAMRLDTEEPAKRVPPVASGEWPLVMSPERYLQLHPKGQYSALARMLEAPKEPLPEEQTDGTANEQG
jgi:hypothetical protein